MMSSIRGTVHESLPYIDTEPTPAERAAAEALIQAELSSDPSSQQQQQTSLPPAYEPNFSPLVTSELERIGSKTPLRAIDLARYEAGDAESIPSDPAALQTSLSQAYTSAAYLAQRRAHLSLLDAYGKNAWLVGNWHLESELQSLERDLAATKKEIDLVNLERKRVQEEVGGEMKLLDEAWRRGVGKVLETEVAVEEVREKVRERQRAG